MSYIQEIFSTTASILTSFGFLAILAFIFKEWLKQYISHFFKSMEIGKQIEIKLNEELLSHSIPMKLEISKIIYESRSCARDIVEKNTPITHRKDNFQQLSSLLTESLFKYRVLFDDETFSHLHDYKRLCQDFMMYLDVSDRQETIQEGQIYFSKPVSEKLNSIYEMIDKSYLEIINVLREGS